MIACVTALNLVAGVLTGIGCLIGFVLFVVAGEVFVGALSFQNIHAMREQKRATKRAHKERLATIRNRASA